ncbi:MAG: hypothetical protein ACFFDW_01110 [Candidatus Thorarchaeota archaeon]
MKSALKILIGISLISIFLIPLSTQFVSGANDQIQVKEGTDAVTVSTEYITMKIMQGMPHFVWWNGNQSTADEMYNVQYTTLQEFIGNNEILDNRGELDGISYNLITSGWLIDVDEQDLEVTITLTLSGLANGAELQFIVHIYAEDQPIPGTDNTVKALQEVKFDIILKDWVFSPNAKGITLKAQIHESQQKHRVRMRTNYDEEVGNKTQTMTFESEEYGNAVVAYYDWTTFADIFYEDEKVSTIDVAAVYLDAEQQGVGSGFQDSGVINQWLVYPNYGDSFTMVHDPSIGVEPDSFNVPLYILPLIAGIITTALIVVAKQKRN